MSYFDFYSLKIVSDQRQQELRRAAESERLAKDLRGERRPWWHRLFAPRPTVVAPAPRVAVETATPVIPVTAQTTATLVA